MKFYTNFDLVGGNALITGYENGVRFAVKEKVKPYLFISSNKTDTHYKTILDRPVDRVDFDTPKEARDFINQYDDVSGVTVYGFDKYEYVHIFDQYRQDIKYNPSDIRILNFDIEVASDDGFPDITLASKEITAITMEMKGKYIVLGCGDFTTDNPDIKYMKCKDEVHLIQIFLRVINSPTWSPDVYTGWNIMFFDIPYIVNRIRLLLGEDEAKKLSPWKILRERKVNIQGRDQTTFNPLGVAVLDYIELYKKFTYVKRESYKLNYIAEVEVGEKKVDYSEYGSLLELYKKNYQKFIEYNIHDTTLVSKIDAKLKLFDLVFAMAYDAKVNFEDTLTTVRQWDVITHNYLLHQRRVVPQFKHKRPTHTIVGGHVKEPRANAFRWVLSFDLTSLYPHLIMQYNISPDTYVKLFEPVGGGDDVDTAIQKIINNQINRITLGDHSLAANMTTYRRDKEGFLPALMSRVFDDRKRYKKEMLNEESKLELAKADPYFDKDEMIAIKNNISRLRNMQMAKKNQLNSLYGALANEYFRWFEEYLAEAITSSGQLSVRWIELAINKYLNNMFKTVNVDYIIAVDTDSVYLNLEKLVDIVYNGKVIPDNKTVVRMLDKFSKGKLEPFIDAEYSKLAKHMNAYQNKMHMKREAIANMGVWTTKKRYILNVYNSEGVEYAEPKVKMQGLEGVRSSTPAYFRDLFKSCYKIILNGTEQELQDLIEKKRIEYFALPFSSVASPRGIHELSKYEDPVIVYKKGTPLHVKGALLYNHHIKSLKLDNMYPLIYEDDNIKFTYLKLPNPIRDTVIATPDDLPPEFKLDKFIDYELQWDKGFEQGIKTILDARGWTSTKHISIEDFF